MGAGGKASKGIAKQRKMGPEAGTTPPVSQGHGDWGGGYSAHS